MDGTWNAARILATVLGLSVRRAFIVECEFWDRIEIHAGFAPVWSIWVARGQHVDDNAREACVRLTQRVGVRVVAAGHLRNLSHKCPTFDASALTGTNFESYLFNVVIGYRTMFWKLRHITNKSVEHHTFLHIQSMSPYISTYSYKH